MMVTYCVYCGSILHGTYLVDYWGNKFCSHHVKEYQSCDYCGRLIPSSSPNSVRRFSGQLVCTICRARSVDHISQARYIFKEIICWINNQGLFFNRLSLNIQFHNQSDIAKIIKRPSENILGAATRVIYSNNNRHQREMGIIALLRGLPPPLFQGVTIHELGHTWCTVHGVFFENDALEEGFCELLAYRYYLQQNDPLHHYYANNIINNPDRIYGEGFRKIKQIQDRLSFNGLLKTLLQNGRIQ